jgi:hypothetical protein
MIPEDQKEMQNELQSIINRIKQKPRPYEANEKDWFEPVTEEDWNDFWYGPELSDESLDTWSGA